MYYRIRFRATPEEFFFELKQDKNVRVQDVIQITKDNFKIKRSALVLLTDGDQRQLDEKEYIESGRTYIVKRIPIDEHVKSRRKRYFYKKTVNKL